MKSINENIKIVIHKLEFLEKIYNNQSFKINLYLSHPNDFVLLDELISHSTDKNSLFVFCEKNKKLIFVLMYFYFRMLVK